MSKSTDINDLEVLITHQEKQINELNDVVITQGREIEALKKYVQLTKSKIQELENNISELGNSEHMSVSDEAAANKPPHY
tara:strand:- start:329 stop:568 length:240 start_codon:yes stop_codon:yes gene_type:complete